MIAIHALVFLVTHTLGFFLALGTMFQHECIESREDWLESWDWFDKEEKTE